MRIGCTLVAHSQCQSGVYAHRMHISCTFGHGMLVVLKVDKRNGDGNRDGADGEGIGTVPKWGFPVVG